MANYLYNGVELPPLPEWDRSRYPRAAIIDLAEGDYELIAFNCNVKFDENYSETLVFDSDEPTSIMLWTAIMSEDSEWVFSEFFDTASNLCHISLLVWSNFDIIDTDGTLIFAASEPEPPQLAWKKHNGYANQGNWRKGHYFKVSGGKWVKQDAVGTVVEIKPEPEYIPVYGVEWDYSQTGAKLTRTDDAVLFSDPTPATSYDAMGESAFDTIMPWAGMRREQIGTDEMVYIPPFYYRATDDATNSKMRWQITTKPREGFALHPGSGRYVSRYHTSSGYASVSGKTPLGSVTVPTLRTNSHAKGDNWWMLDIATWSAIQILYLVEFADWDIQSTLGSGQTSGSMKATGGTDAAVYHSVKRNDASNQYRWIENLYSNTRDYVDGLVMSDYQVYVGTDNRVFGDTVSGLLDTELTVPRANVEYIKRLAISDVASWLFVPAEVESSENHIPDTVQTASGVMWLAAGSQYASDPRLGIFSFDVNQSKSTTSATIGSRLIYIP